MNNHERRNYPMAVILRYFNEFGKFGANYVTVLKLSPYSLEKCNPENLFSTIYDLWRNSQILLRNGALKRGILR